jgi:hypothetical protein
MATITLIASRENGRLFLNETETAWPEERAKRSSRGDWSGARNPELLLKLFARYKLWQIQGHLEAVREVLRGKPCPTSESFDELCAKGVLTGESAGAARVHCDLYKIYLSRYLV